VDFSFVLHRYRLVRWVVGELMALEEKEEEDAEK
jgi:hypothetical protein